MRKIVALLMVAVASAAVPGSTHGGEITCSGTAPIEAACSAPFEIGDHGLRGVRAWTTPGFVGVVTVEVRTSTGAIRAECAATGLGGYLPCATGAADGTVKAGQSAVLGGGAGGIDPSVPPAGRWMVVAQA